MCEGSARSPNKSNPINLPPPHANKERVEKDYRVTPPSLPSPGGVEKGKISCELVETSVSFIVQSMSPLI